MDSPMICKGLGKVIAASHNPAKRRLILHYPRRSYATPTQNFPQGEVQAAAPIAFSSNLDQFASQNFPRRGVATNGGLQRYGGPTGTPLLEKIRVVPASPSYFTATPQYTDDLLYLSHLLRKYQLLPTLPPAEAPRTAWKTLEQYKTELAEPVRSKGHSMLLQLLRRLNMIHPSLMPVEVERAMLRYKRNVQPQSNVPNPIVIDRWGRARGVGRRKSSHAAVYVVEGEGQCMINGKTLSEYFATLHDRESAVWALKATQRLDKYNVWAIARGGGTTGQAEAITLGVAKALLAHEPDLKPALRRAGCVTRDPRKVERKKPGKLKARKMPAWVKR